MLQEFKTIYKEFKKDSGRLNPFSSKLITYLEDELKTKEQNSKKPLKVYHKRKQTETKDQYEYQYENDQLRDQNECVSLFYNLYYSEDSRYINFFKIMKKKLQEFGVIIKRKKKKDEGYLIILEQFFEELIGNYYVSGETRKSKQIFLDKFSEDFNIKIENNDWAQFMGILDQIFVEYCQIQEMQISQSQKDRVNFNLEKKIEENQDYELVIYVSDCSDVEPAQKQKKQQNQKTATMATEKEAEEFQRQQQNQKLEVLNETSLTHLQKFQKLYGQQLKQADPNYWENLVVCFDYLSNTKISNDDIFDHLQRHLQENIEATLFLINNRDEINQNLQDAKKKSEIEQKKKNFDTAYSRIQSSIIIKKKKKKEKQQIDQEAYLQNLGLKEQVNDLKEENEKMRGGFIAQNKDDDNDLKNYNFMQTDFFRETEESLKKNYRMRRIEDATNIIFNVDPKQKNQLYKQTKKLMIDEIFPSHIQPIFTDSDHLNNLQSIIYESIYTTNENILCCAPTGAGKTNVALMSIVRLIHKNFDKQTQKVTGNFKIIYISPLKALATEIQRKFQKKLEFLGVIVREFTGDVALSKKELAGTHIIISTPEKWDVVTRKSEELNSMINLLIIDEIHLLDDERGRVLESLVARTVRLIEAKQCQIRLVGLSATLPNYIDVAKFLKVGENGLFFFDESFRPVPLSKKFIGVKKLDQRTITKSKDLKALEDNLGKKLTALDMMNLNAYDVCIESLKKNQQVLVFVHSRKETIKLAEYFIFQATQRGELSYFLKDSSSANKLFKRVDNMDLKRITQKGIGAHNAGIKRKDRLTIEKAFNQGELSVVVTTATLAWGINMPCHTVIIKGTDFYDPGYGFKPISLLDVQQIFGRAGRPQFDSYGEAVLITNASDLQYFVSMLSYVRPIESKFRPFMKEALLAEIVLGNICNLKEALDFLKATFYYVRMGKNPTFYGIKNPENKEVFLFEHIHSVLEELHFLRLIRFEKKSGIIEATELGRIASHYYVNCETIEMLCQYLNIYDDDDRYQKGEDIDEKNLIGIIAQASEFEQISAKQEEEPELMKLKKRYQWINIDDSYKILYDSEARKDKSNTNFDPMEKILLLVYAYLERIDFETYSLQADTNYIIQNSSRILRCLLDIALKQNNAPLTEKIIVWMRYIENCVHEDSTPLRMFCFDNYIRSGKSIRNSNQEINKFNFIPNSACRKIEWAMDFKDFGHIYRDIGQLREEIGMLRDLNLSVYQEKMLKQGIFAYPIIDLIYDVKPIARTILQINLKIKVLCTFTKKFHANKEIFWVLAQDNDELLYHGNIAIDITQANLKPLIDGPSTKSNPYLEHSFFVPLRESSSYYTIKVMSNNYIDSDSYCDINLRDIALDFEEIEYTPLLDLRPLKVQTLQNPEFEKLYDKIKFFNPLQTQVFFSLYHTDENIIVGAPTGSGKTIISELAMLRVFNRTPRKKIIYIAPYKALVKERVRDWKKRFVKKLNKRVEELSGDYTPDFQTLVKADLLVTTPEKWDGVSRNWLSRTYVKNVGLIVFDEIHLLGQERGPIVEVIVSRMNYIANQLKDKVRMIGLSTAMANASDLGTWFGAKKQYIFNFSPNVRPIPVTIHFRGFAEKNYCPRMNSMNKPAYNDIKKFASGLPVLIFVSSRRQTRLTALDLISLAANEFQMKSPFLKMNFEESSAIISKVEDSNLKNTLAFGIGIHHAGLIQSDRIIVEELFEASKIQVLVATSTLAWGVNFPAKLVIIKGTEFFDPKTHGYVDMPISDILQMVGRAGRPQYNDKGIACVYVDKTKKNFYRKYLNDPFPIESDFLKTIDIHFNAEISTESIQNKQQCVDYLTWTYFFKRILRNPAFYGLTERTSESLKQYLIDIVDKSLKELESLNCIEIDDDEFNLRKTFLGTIASNYYLLPKSVYFLSQQLKVNLPIKKLLMILSHVEEYAEVPVRHNEDQMNVNLSNICPYPVDKRGADSPKIKTFLLFQAYFSSLPLPIRDYITDTKLVLDSSFRIIAAMIDISASNGLFQNCIYLIQMLQMIVQGKWIDSSVLYNLPYFNKEIVNELKAGGIEYLSEMMQLQQTNNLGKILKNLQNSNLTDKQVATIERRIASLPNVQFKVDLFRIDSDTLEKEHGPYCFRGGEEAVLEVSLYRINFKESLELQIKKLQKNKKCSWWLVIGNMNENLIYGIKKFTFQKSVRKSINLDIPIFGEKSFNRYLEIYLMSDSIIGIDQIEVIDLMQYEVPPLKKQ